MNTKKLAEISIIFMGVCLFVYLLKFFANFLRPFTIAVIMTFLFVPLTRISSKKKWGILGGTILSILLLIGGIFGIGYLYTDSGDGKVIEQVGFVENVKTLIDTEMNFFGSTYSLSSVVDVSKIYEYVSVGFKFIFNSTTIFVSELFLIILFVSFLLPSYEIWVSKISSVLKAGDKRFFLQTLKEIEKSIRDYLSVKALVSFGTAFVSFVIMLIFKVEFAMVFALMIFALNFIPNIGSIIAVGVIILSHFIQVGLSVSLVVLLILLILVQLIFGNIIEPSVTGNKLNISPIVVILSLFFWGSIWGIGGMLFSVPLTVIIKILLKRFEGF